jgi:2-amino-4-hydroxy-6-hydroxymethyldihydropteridine diphosphokinase
MRTAYIGMGANLPRPSGSGPAESPEATLAAAVERLALLGRVTARSSLYSTAPVGFADQPRFVNAAVALETDLQPRTLLDALLGIEREFGRDRSAAIPNGPRTLDLDILLIDGVEVSEPGLEIPHPRLAERAFALIPLNEIAPQARDPRTGATIAEWLQRLLSINAADALHGVVPIHSDVWHASHATSAR